MTKTSIATIQAFFLIICFAQAHGEDLFRWTDDAGKPSYSNVAPPIGVEAYSVDTISRPALDRSSSAQVSADTNAAKEISAETYADYSGSSETLLKQRIMDRERSIGRIEALLRKHPNETVLRKSLSRKKRYLSEDLAWLKKNNRQ
jgi:hypothetical protein